MEGSMWGAEADAALLNLLERFKPCGAQRPFAIASLRSALKAALPSSSFTCEAVGRRVCDYYNFDSGAMADVRAALEKPLKIPSSYKLPRRIWMAEKAAGGGEAGVKKEVQCDAESGASDAVSAEASPRLEETVDAAVSEERKRKRRSASPGQTSAAKRSTPSKQETEGARRRQQRAEEIYRSVKAKTGRFQSIGELAYGALRDLGGAAPFEQLAAHIESKDVWAQLERKQALRIERDAKTAGEELRSQLRQALGHSSLFGQRSDGQYTLRDDGEAEGSGAS